MEQRQKCHDEAVSAITAAARIEGAHGPEDLAGFVAGVLAEVAANLGSVERLLAGRPGSWEADLVERLVTGTTGDRPADLLRYRTAPVVVPLNVRELAEAANVAGATYADVERDISGRALPTVREEQPDGEVVEYTDDDAVDAQNAALEAARQEFTQAYARYAAAFTRAVHQKAATFEGLRAPVQVRVDTDPESTSDTVTNPGAWEAYPDPLVLLLWNHARATVGEPTVEFDADHDDAAASSR
jgi:hypothetical protein